MPRAKWNEEQIIGILKQVEAGRTVVEVCRENGVGESTFYKWKSKYGGLEVNEARRLKSLEDENSRLKRLLADSMLANAALKDALSKTGEACCKTTSRSTLYRGIWLVAAGALWAEACELVSLQRCVYRYRSRRADDVALRERLKQLAREHPPQRSA